VLLVDHADGEAADRERARAWIAQGAGLSPTVRSLLERPEPAPAPAA